MLAVDGLWLWQEERSGEETPRRSSRSDRERRNRGEAETAGDLERQEEGNRDVTKPKQWTGRQAAKAATKRKQPAPNPRVSSTPKQPVEPIPDEIEVQDEQTTIGST